MLPGTICSREYYGAGISSHNNVSITDEFDLYNLDENGWMWLIHVLGDEKEFWEFYNNILEEVYKKSGE